MMAVGSSSWFNPAIRISPEHRAALRRPRSQHRVIEPAKPVANGMHWHLDARLATASRRAQCSCVRRLLHCELVAADAIDPGHQRSTVGIRHVAVIHRLESPSALLLAKRQTAWSCWHCRRALSRLWQLYLCVCDSGNREVLHNSRFVRLNPGGNSLILQRRDVRVV